MELSDADKEIIKRLRKAGCLCPTPLIGERPDIGPRCRLCNTVSIEHSIGTKLDETGRYSNTMG